VSVLNGGYVFSATAFSTDGEATVYRDGDYRGDFMLAYRAAVRVQPRNKAWSTLSVTFLGGPPPADAITIGLIPDRDGAHVFTSTMRNGIGTFRDTQIVCSKQCNIAIRSRHGSISALVAGKVISSWPRFAFSLPRPTVQLNAEVSGLGDRIQATLTPLEERAATVRLATPVCAFTTQGVIPLANARTLGFHGSFVRNVPAHYIDLRNGRRFERCPPR
jgi:hypothetical protein